MLSTVEKVLLLQELDLFRKASTEHLARLAAVAEERELDAGRRIFERNEPVSRAFFLVEGRVRLEKSVDGFSVGECCLLDMLSVLSEGRHSVSAETIDTCTLLVVSYDDLIDLLTDEAEFCWTLLRHIAAESAETGEG